MITKILDIEVTAKMSEQAQILAQMQELIMEILKSGSVSEEGGRKINHLEDLLHQQACFKELENSQHAYLGEEIASLFFAEQRDKAIESLKEHEISVEDFFGFVEYHYDEEHEDETKAEMFTPSFIAQVAKEF